MYAVHAVTQVAMTVRHGQGDRSLLASDTDRPDAAASLAPVSSAAAQQFRGKC